MGASLAVRAPEKPEKLVYILWEQIPGKDEVQQPKKLVKGGLREVGNKVEDKEAADGVLQGDLGSRTQRFVPPKQVTQQRRIFGVLLLQQLDT